MFSRVGLIRAGSFDETTQEGRSNERLRRAVLTTLSTGGARAVGLMVSLISVPLTFRSLGAERYGLWMILVSIIAAMAVADLGIGNGLVNTISEAYGRDDRHLARQCVTSALVMMTGIACVLVFAGVVAYPHIPWNRVFNVQSSGVAAEGSHAFMVLYGWFIVSIPLGVVSRAQSGLQKGYLPPLIGAFGSVLTLLSLLVVIHIHGRLPLLVFSSTIGPVIGVLINGYILFRQHPWLFPTLSAYSSRVARRLLRLGLMFFILQCAVAIGYSSDNIVITQILGVASVAAYAVPQKLFSFVAMVLNMATMPLWPAYGEAIARGDVGWVRRIFFKSLRLTLYTSVPLCIALTLTAPWILRLVGRTSRAPMSLLLVLALWGIVESLSGPIVMLLHGAGVLKEQSVIAIVVSILNLGLSILCTHHLGVVGVCIGSITAQLLIAFPLYAVLIRRLLSKLATQELVQTVPTE